MSNVEGQSVLGIRHAEDRISMQCFDAVSKLFVSNVYTRT
ncbi:hypothetical protein SynRS9915_01350 [Synechococcus sp. RS9915]|nr:hypothetical protein SynRS9915_01350 [Synechococcus sp. RS9915]